MQHDDWVKLADALPVGASKTVKTAGRQLAVFQLSETKACAIDNRCPHQGYPLATGDTKSDGGEVVLTCAWHNWKFRLPDGACLVGGEAVQAYETEMRDDGVYARLVDPPLEVQRGTLYEALEAAIDDEDDGRAARTMERLLMLGEPAMQVLGWLCALSAKRLEWGFEHGLAASADLADMLSRKVAPDGLVLLQALQLLMDGLARRPAQAFAPADERSGGALRTLVADEDLAGAEAATRGSASRDALLDTFVDIATDGFLDFGHGLIFVAQAEQLSARLADHGDPHDHPILTSLTRNLVFATREHTLPPMRHFMKLVAAREPLSLAQVRLDVSFDVEPFFSHVLDGDLESAIDAVDQAVAAGIEPKRIALALGLAAGERLLRFDPAHEHDFDITEGWLHVTHALTYAEATFQLLRRRPSDSLLRALRYGARFIQHMAPLDGPPEVVAEEPETDPTADLAAVLDQRDVGAARRLARTSPLAELRRAIESDMLGDRLTRQIFVAHHIKTGAAALRLAEAAATDPDLASWSRRPLEGTVRWLCHPMRERRIARNARIAERFVRQGLRTRDLC